MVFHWSLNDSKSYQVSRTFLSIQADISNALFSTSSLISNSSSPFTNSLEIAPSAQITSDITGSFMVRIFFSYFARSKYLSLFWLFLKFHSVVCWDSKVHYSASSLFLLLQGLVYPRLGDTFVSVCISKSQNVRLIFQEVFWVVLIPLVRKVKFKYLAQLPVDHHAHPVVSSLIFILRLFISLSYHVIACFVSITT